MCIGNCAMKIVLIGLGSIGRRYINLLQGRKGCSLYAYRSKKSNKPNDLGVKELFSWKEIAELSPEVAFITNPTYLHVKTAMKCAGMGMNLFIEKPIDCSLNQLDPLIRLVNKKKITAYVAYCMRFHPVINEIRKIIKNRKILHARIVVSSFLPDWRPCKDYRTNYSASRQKGGGVVFDLSHELDYAQYLFGDVLEMKGVYGKISELAIDTEDYANIILLCKKAVVNVHMNYFSKNVQRKIAIDFSNSDYLEADLLSGRILIYKNSRISKRIVKFSNNDLYQKQLKYFFSNIDNRNIMNNLDDASKLFKKIVVFKNEKKQKRKYSGYYSG